MPTSPNGSHDAAKIINNPTLSNNSSSNTNSPNSYSNTNAHNDSNAHDNSNFNVTLTSETVSHRDNNSWSLGLCLLNVNNESASSNVNKSVHAPESGSSRTGTQTANHPKSSMMLQMAVPRVLLKRHGTSSVAW